MQPVDRQSVLIILQDSLLTIDVRDSYRSRLEIYRIKDSIRALQRPLIKLFGVIGGSRKWMGLQVIKHRWEMKSNRESMWCLEWVMGS